MSPARRSIPALSSMILLAAVACGTPAAEPGAPDTAPLAESAATTESTGAGDSATGADASATAAMTEAAPSGEAENPFEEGGNLEVPAAMIAEAMDGGFEVVFVDARTALDYESGHIPGAVSVPYFEAKDHLDKVPKDKWAIVYCECPTAEARQVADVLMANGYTKVKIIAEGLAGWRDLGRTLDGGTPEGGASDAGTPESGAPEGGTPGSGGTPSG